MQASFYGFLCFEMFNLSPTFCENGFVPLSPFWTHSRTMSVIYDIWRFLITLAYSGFITPSISSSRISDKGSRISKSSATPRVRRSPRSAKHGRIPWQCHEIIDQATQQRCRNVEGYQGIIVDECENSNAENHFNVYSSCRTRVS